MKVAHLARKPISEGSVGRNTLVHGTGGLNIDGVRTFCGTEHFFAKPPPPRPSRGMVAGGSDEREGAALGMFRPGATYQPTNHPGGRWPSNVILIHEPDCHKADETPEDVWECVEGCPARELDAQSVKGGIHSAGNQKLTASTPGGRGIYGAWEPRAVNPDFYQDSGGASRFFKQVKP